MADKFKKLDKEYVLSDSSVNEYGFRLLTEGYQLHEFQKNPIGYYMHRREDGVVLKWSDISITGDTITGRPVINLSNGRGAQTCQEAENGFLNAASMGHIVVLEYATDPALMLPGQTGPTITKWYNKECSLVDIPGNNNALVRLYDAQENEISLAGFTLGGIVEKRDAVQLAHASEKNIQLVPMLENLLGMPGAGIEALFSCVKDRLDKMQALEAAHQLVCG